MIISSLSSYIQENLQKGYSASAIQKVLVDQGYAEPDVQETIQHVQNQSPSAQEKPDSKKKPMKALMISIPIVLVLVIGVGAVFFFMGSSSNSLISDDELSQGIVVSVKQTESFRFNLNQVEHVARVIGLDENKIRLDFEGATPSVDLTVGEEQLFDADSDDYYDLSLELQAIDQEVTHIRVQKIHQSICIENWECDEWNNCSEQGEQTRTCQDNNNCGTVENKPELTRTCDYKPECQEDWKCEEWSECLAGQQTRTCDDQNACGTISQKPVIRQNCAAEQNNTENNNSTQNQNITINPDDIDIGITFEQDSFETGEEVLGEYDLRYDGPSFRGAIIYVEPLGLTKIAGEFDDVDFSDSEKTNALKLTLSDTFSENGTYNYSMYIYDCAEINKQLLRDDCGGVLINQIPIETIFEEVSALKSVTESIEVVLGEEGESDLECTSNSDCTQTCSNCQDGTYQCLISSNASLDHTCVECVTDFSCNEGFECTDHHCVALEQESNDNETINESETYPVTNPETILDCYSENLTEMLCSPELALSFTNTFADRLVSCELSQGTFALGLEPAFGLFRSYTIQGEQDSMCSIEFGVLEHDNLDPSLIGKHMMCEYNSSQRTTQDVGSCFEDCCSGELLDAIIELYS